MKEVTELCWQSAALPAVDLNGKAHSQGQVPEMKSELAELNKVKNTVSNTLLFPLGSIMCTNNNTEAH